MINRFSQTNIYRGTGGSIDNINDFFIIIANLIQVGLVLSGMLAIIFISWSGIQYITSQGDPQKVQSAKSGLRNSIVGLILAAGSYMLVKFFSSRLLA